MKVNREEMIQHVEQQRASGKSVAAYAREYAIPYHRLKYWSHRVPASKGTENESFVLLGSRPPASDDGGVHLQLNRSGAVLQFDRGCTPEYVATVCRLVLAC